MIKKQEKLLKQNNLTPELLRRSNALQNIKSEYIGRIVFVCMVNLLVLAMFAGLSDYRLFFIGLPIIAVITAIHSYISIHNYKIDIANYLERAKTHQYQTLRKYFNKYAKKNQLQYFIRSTYMQWNIERSQTLADGSERITMVSANGLYHFTIVKYNDVIECMYNFY